MTTRFFSLLLLLFFISTFTTAQNLVPNHSFEEFEDGCPETFNGTTAFAWEKWAGSPDLFSTCVDPQTFNDSLGWVPWNGVGYQWPADGESYAGLFAHGQVGADWSQNFREYIGCELLEPLQVGETYFVSFKVSTGIIGSYYWITTACNRLGALFTTQGHHWSENPLEIPNFAHVYEENIISDTANWVTISGSFIADQAFTHMGLGVFFEFNLLEVIETHSHTGGLGSYYYVDDVCVSRSPECMPSSIGESGSGSDNIIVYPNPANAMVVVESSHQIERAGLLDASGKWVKNPININDQRVVWQTSDLPSGMYYLEIHTTSGIKREKLMVVH